MRFAECVKLLAVDAETQLRFLGPVPENAHVRGYIKTNSVFRMAWLYRVSYGVYDSVGGNESIEDWRCRTELEHFTTDDLGNQFWKSARRLLTSLEMIDELDRPFLWTAHGLRSAPEWELVRHLARETCAVERWSLNLEIESFETLWNGLGDGLIDFAWPDF